MKSKERWFPKHYHVQVNNFVPGATSLKLWPETLLSQEWGTPGQSLETMGWRSRLPQRYGGNLDWVFKSGRRWEEVVRADHDSAAS